MKGYVLLRYFFVPIHRAGWTFILLFLSITTLTIFVWWPLSVPMGVITLWCVYFFRDPHRVISPEAAEIIAPADGMVLGVSNVKFPTNLLNKQPFDECIKISIFMSIFNVHVNRSPASGMVIDIKYHQGRFFNAALDKASQHNERNAIWLRTKNNLDVVFVQIAGLVARRINCDLTVGQSVEKGQKYGIIKFGSRLDIYVPKNLKINILPGQTSIAGETVLASIT